MVLAAVALTLAGTAGPALAQDDEPFEDESGIEVPDDGVEVPDEPLEPGDDEGDWDMAPDAGEDVVLDEEDDGIAESEDALDDVQPPNARLSAPARTRLRTLLAKGLSGRVSCAEPCSVLVELRRGGARGKVVGHRSVRIPAAGGHRTFRLRVDAKARRLVRRTAQTQLHLTAAAGDAAGNHRVVTRRVTLGRR